MERFESIRFCSHKSNTKVKGCKFLILWFQSEYVIESKINNKEKQLLFHSFLQGSQGQTITLSSLPQSAIVSSSGSTLLIQPSQVKISYHFLIAEHYWRVVWSQLWNFLGRRAKFNVFLNSIEHPERIYLYCVRQFDVEW